jgi:hypothetical protein
MFVVPEHWNLFVPKRFASRNNVSFLKKNKLEQLFWRNEKGKQVPYYYKGEIETVPVCTIRSFYKGLSYTKLGNSMKPGGHLFFVCFSGLAD